MFFCELLVFYDNFLGCWRWHVIFDQKFSVTSGILSAYINVSAAFDSALKCIDILSEPNTVIRNCEVFTSYGDFEIYLFERSLEKSVS
jgi:hypothetical protein